MGFVKQSLSAVQACKIAECIFDHKNVIEVVEQEIVLTK